MLNGAPTINRTVKSLLAVTLAVPGGLVLFELVSLSYREVA